MTSPFEMTRTIGCLSCRSEDGFIGPIGLCVPCFRREWSAKRTPAWNMASPRQPMAMKSWLDVMDDD